MSSYMDHGHNLEQRLHEVRSLLTTINDEAILETSRTDALMSSLSGIEQLAEKAAEEYYAMLDKVREMEKSSQ
ncbi:hypothetical protein LV476_05275 [Guyparkeria hydrothermalis]|uniref:hypothetical protein n=1 Tax=Guyparkeria hydrothermalis TaxID=923 RepID=UPI002021DB08|nr:hypothetical protein [Guyparkeria hydrothermalis]MCL7744363.1 hypothetical protein [Guyparkeria hydrothermalis]